MPHQSTHTELSHTSCHPPSQPQAASRGWGVVFAPFPYPEPSSCLASRRHPHHPRCCLSSMAAATTGTATPTSTSSSTSTRPRRRSGGPSLPFVGLLSLLLFIICIQPRSVHADSCASFSDCFTCSNSSFSCHWCGADNKCHTIGSPYGCLTGVNCYTSEACVRAEPQPMPHPAPSGSVLVGLGVFLLTSLLCTSACFFVANEYVHHATVVRVEKDPNYQELRAFDDEEEEGGREGTSGGARAGGGSSPIDTGGGGGGGIENDTWDPIPRITVIERSRFLVIFSKLIRAMLILAVGWLLLVAVAVLLYTPQVPDVNVCNTALDWGSIFSGFEKLKLEADYQLLLSV